MADVTSPANGLWLDSETTPGIEPTVKNADGTTINSGGPAGTIKTLGHTAAVALSSFTAQPAPAGSLAAGGKF